MLFKPNIRIYQAIIIISSIYACRSNHNNENSSVPNLDFLLIDSTTHLTTDKFIKGNPFALLYFSPDCEHCQAEISEILKHMNSLKTVHFYLITNDPLHTLKDFNNAYGLSKYTNITICWDNQFYFPRQFKGAFPPYLVLYDGNRNQKGIYEGDKQITDIITAVRKL